MVRVDKHGTTAQFLSDLLSKTVGLDANEPGAAARRTCQK